MRHTKSENNGSASAAALAPSTVLVESLGMQHWLNMALASRQGIAMNLQFPMPTRFMWQIARQILGDDLIPEQSTYKREVLTWRIYDLIQSDQVIENTDNSPIQRYFAQLSEAYTEDFAAPIALTHSMELNQAKKLQFCRSLADVYEQYMLYRPDWLSSWENNQLIADSEGLSQQDERWQASIWRDLSNQQPYHPASLHTLTLDALAVHRDLTSVQLPKHIFVFALNTMAPQLVNFLDALANHCDIHIFHLNPCINYWGDLQSEKQKLRHSIRNNLSGMDTQIDQWLDDKSDNLLLANLGLQGRDLFNLLQQQPSFEVSAFDAPMPDEKILLESNTSPLLLQVKQAIFEGRSQPSETFHTCSDDDSIVVVKAHSPLRELQGLHDYLLDCLDSDSHLEPRDILIMCPAIEDYAAFIPAVFSVSGQGDVDARIPCSVADRAPLDSMPEVSAFLTLLDITQSRFEVSAIVDYLRLPAIQKRFAIAEQELDIIIRWMSSARIHWGLNAAHKQRFIDIEHSSDINTWEWGLKRLLIGFAQIDEAVLQGDLLTLPDAEGQQSEVLGKLCLLLEQLQWHLQQLKEPRDALQWQAYLLGVRQRFFTQDDNNERAIGIIEKGIGELVSHCSMAGYQGSISIFVLRDALSHSFTAPDAINQFMTGQVTFCSMLPMRSIPFKMIAMLGLNDGEFPRVSSPFSIDLMQSSARRLGDRSRRGDDRYLFLESIISARQRLYLSYQSKSVKDNSERQPSLVLREFCDYLQQSFGDDMQADETPYRAYELPLHAFHSSHFEANQNAVIPSYDQGWLRLAKSILSNQKFNCEKPQYQIDKEPSTALSSAELTKALTDPLKYFANRGLGLYLDSNEPELLDSEPFSIDGLSRYQILTALIEANLDSAKMTDSTSVDPILTWFEADGSVPSDVVSKSTYVSWLPAVIQLQQAMDSYHLEAQTLSAECGALAVDASVRFAKQEDTPIIIDYRAASMRSHHHLKVRIDQLVASLTMSHPVAAKVFCLEQKDGEPTYTYYEYPGIEPDIALVQLHDLCQAYRSIQLSPQLLHCDLGELVASKSMPESEATITPKLMQAWDSAFNPNFLAEQGVTSVLTNDYFRWFYPTVPPLELANVVTLKQCYTDTFTLYSKNGRKPRQQKAAS